jgi:OOP family OmpA-OmpF porin
MRNSVNLLVVPIYKGVRNLHRQFYQGLLVVSLALCSSFALAAMEDLKEPLFEESSAALRAANELNGAILAPTSYKEGAELYRRAEKTLADGGTLESIRRDLNQATKAFQKSAKFSAIADAAFGGTLQARADAVNAEAATYAPNAWLAADTKFSDAMSSMEKGRKRSAERSGGQALELFRQAELDAIKANYLNETRALLEKADDKKAERWAPKSFADASRLLTEAETALNKDRYDTDRPRSLAQQAKHSAKHAIYVSRMADAIDDNDTNLEDLLSGWEASIGRLAAQVDVPVDFDDGQEQAISIIQTAVVNLQSQLALQANSISERDEQINALNAQMAQLQQNLGSKSEAAEALNEVLVQQERNRLRFASVENLFNVDQANVLRKGNTVIVRMIGLTFDSNAASLKPEHDQVLNLLNQAIAEFPGAIVVIEGHTDSFGSDKTNLSLSQQRAESVEAYLVNQGLPPGRLTPRGYGESQPVANHESSEGRRRNRRIDVVLYPPQ